MNRKEKQYEIAKESCIHQYDEEKNIFYEDDASMPRTLINLDEIHENKFVNLVPYWGVPDYRYPKMHAEENEIIFFQEFPDEIVKGHFGETRADRQMRYSGWQKTGPFQNEYVESIFSPVGMISEHGARLVLEGKGDNKYFKMYVNTENGETAECTLQVEVLFSMLQKLRETGVHIPKCIDVDERNKKDYPKE